jgi:translation initiation factor IF-1
MKNENNDRDDRVEMQGIVDECMPGTLFRIRCGGAHDGHMVLATLGGKLRQNRIRLLPGDSVRIEVSPYDLSRGRVVYRL